MEQRLILNRGLIELDDVLEPDAGNDELDHERGGGVLTGKGERINRYHLVPRCQRQSDGPSQPGHCPQNVGFTRGVGTIYSGKRQQPLPDVRDVLDDRTIMVDGAQGQLHGLPNRPKPGNFEADEHGSCYQRRMRRLRPYFVKI